MTLLVQLPASYPREREWIVDVILGELLGLDVRTEATERPDVRITGRDGQRGELIVSDDLFTCAPEDWLGRAALPRRPLPQWNVGAAVPEAIVTAPNLPVLYGEARLEQTHEGFELGLDAFGSSFFLLTRYEELVEPERDRHGRFPAAASLAVQEQYLDRPLVNEYAEVVWALLQRLWPRLERKLRTHRVLLSHDVDWPVCSEPAVRELMRATLGDGLLVREQRALTLDGLRRHVRHDTRRDLCDTFDFLMDESDRNGVRSAFYFISAGTVDGVDGRYSLDDPRLRRLLRRIHERGHEIGLHPSYNTFRDAERTRYEFELLRRVCEEEGIEQDGWGGRQHYLRWENPTTWRNWDAAGLAYDSTLTFAESPGFRCGACFEYPVFDLRARKRLTLRERPLVAMEVSLLVYQRLGLSAAGDSLADLRERTRLFKGDFTLLWHNSRLITRADRRQYRQAVQAGASPRRARVGPEQRAS